MRVKLMPMVDPDSLKDLNKSGISSNGRSLSNNGRRKEWKATQFKSISISKVNTQANNQKSFETHLAQNRNLDVNKPTNLEENKYEASDSDRNGSSSPDPMNNPVNSLPLSYTTGLKM